MRYQEAFHAITAALAARDDTEVIHGKFDEESFGNFLISFVKNGRPLSLVLDRGDLIIAKGLNATRDFKPVLMPLDDFTEREVLSALEEAIEAHSNSTMT